ATSRMFTADSYPVDREPPGASLRVYPIDTGRFWVYSSPGGGSQSATVEAPESFAGSIVQPLRWDGGVSEYLSQDGAGRVFHHGLTYPDGGYVVNDPPTLVMDSELTLGHEWEASHDVIEYSPDGVEVFRLWERWTYRVIDIGPVDVPAGTFDTAEVLITVEREPLARAAFPSGASLLSSAPQGASLGQSLFYTLRNTYAEGIGWILRTDENGTSVLFELEAYGGGPVPTEATTWGAVKSLYKN
ncbi:MAG: hypothetical protein OEO21_10265, partial [Candidatus Krumholzibacteria bacterium]|nr:hypothetical protein [Candidatus Krumholzibacteria bacterium]